MITSKDDGEDACCPDSHSCLDAHEIGLFLSSMSKNELKKTHNEKNESSYSLNKVVDEPGPSSFWSGFWIWAYWNYQFFRVRVGLLTCPAWAKAQTHRFILQVFLKENPYLSPNSRFCLEMYGMGSSCVHGGSGPTPRDPYLKLTQNLHTVYTLRPINYRSNSKLLPFEMVSLLRLILT